MSGAHPLVDVLNGLIDVVVSIGDCAIPGLILTPPKCPAQTCELRTPERNDNPIRTGKPPPDSVQPSQTMSVGSSRPAAPSLMNIAELLADEHWSSRPWNVTRWPAIAWMPSWCFPASCA